MKLTHELVRWHPWETATTAIVVWWYGHTPGPLRPYARMPGGKWWLLYRRDEFFVPGLEIRDFARVTIFEEMIRSPAGT